MNKYPTSYLGGRTQCEYG